MNDDDLSIVNWNVRGLNCPGRRTAVHESIVTSACNIACLQETKLQDLDAATSAYLGGFRMRGFAQRPATGTRGGIEILWNDNLFRISDIIMGIYCLSLTIITVREESSFRLTSVYGPTESNQKEIFFRGACGSQAGAWRKVACKWGFQSNLPCKRQEQEERQPQSYQPVPRHASWL